MSDQRQNGVSVEHIDGQWAVQVVENGKVFQRLFETEEFAENFAAGQRARLRPAPEKPASKRRPVV